MDIRFKRLNELPSQELIKTGTFYWIGDKVWFATAPGNVVLLSNEVGQDLLDRLAGIEGRLENIDELFGSDGIDFNEFITRDEVDRLFREWSPDMNLDDSDYDNIAERVKLTWQIIK